MSLSTTCLCRELKCCLTYNNGIQCCRRHKDLVQKQNPGKRAAFVQNAHIKTFANWICGEVNNCILIIIVCLFMSLHLKLLK